MVMTYKDTDKIKERIIKRFCFNCDYRDITVCSSCIIADCIDKIDDAEKADVQSVKHGYWEDCEGGRCRCSCCHALKEQYYDSFCSNCGAKLN